MADKDPGFSQGTLAADLRGLGLRSGQVVLVHASLRSIGWMATGVNTIVGALREVIGGEGTLVVPTFTSGNSDTSRAYNERARGMRKMCERRLRASMPAFDIDESSSIECGQLSEYVRKHPQSIRSAHPQTSFAALGPEAAGLMADHDPDNHLGERSPLAKLFQREARVVLLGVGFDKCTAFHLAEYRYVPSPPLVRYGCVVKAAGGPTWHHYDDVVLDDSDFAHCGALMEQSVKVVSGLVGQAESRCFALAEAVNFAQRWLWERRS